MPLIRIKACLSQGPCQGQPHEWEFTAPRLKEMRVLQSRTGMNLGAWQTALNSQDAEALTGLVDLLHRREGVVLRWEDVDLDFTDLEFAETEGERVEREAAEAAAGKEAGPEA